MLTAGATLVLIGAGGLVTSHEAGMAVPDWPNTYGYNMFAFPFSRWIGGVLYEHGHRLIASAVGLLTTVLAAWLWARETRGGERAWGIAAIGLVILLMGARIMPVYLALAGLALPAILAGLWRFSRRPRELRWLGIVALAAVILQGVLGGLRVVWLNDELGIFHAALAQLFFVLTCVIALLTSRWWSTARLSLLARPAVSLDAEAGTGAPALRGLFLLTTALILLQLILGATMRHQHAGLAIPDFPLAYGRLWPATDADAVLRYNQQRVEVTSVNPITRFQIELQMAHRLLALLILAAVGLCVWRILNLRGLQTAAAAARRSTGHAAPPPSPPSSRDGIFESTAVAPPTPPRAFMRSLTCAWLGLILVQAGLGAATILSNKAADIATAHVMLGALSLAMGGILSIVYDSSPER